jgi:diaminopimelate epimerase
MRFVKLQATGNDFILIQSDEERDWSSLAKSVCDRHFGIGADGLIILVPSMVADLGMKIFNQDGSAAEICGNGLRCLVRYAIDKGLVDKGVLAVETSEGLKTVRVQGELFQVDMGVPKFKATELPMNIEDNVDIILDYPVDVKGKELPITCLSMGNPHAVHFTEEPVARFPLTDIGPEIESNNLFPNRVNFEVANVMSPQRIIARVWERGVGETLSCGSGACAAVVASRLHDWVADEVDVILPGGMLTISWDGAGEVKLRGPAEIVFQGEWGKQERAADL